MRVEEEEGRIRGGDALIRYVTPGCEPSVVMGRHLDTAGMPRALPSLVVSHLQIAGIRRLVVGHTPHGK